MTIYDNKGGGRREPGGVGMILLVFVVLALVIGTLFMATIFVPQFNPGTQHNNQGASGGSDPSAPVP